MIDDARDIADHICSVNAESFHAVVVGSNAVRARLERKKSLIHSVDRRRCDIRPLPFQCLDDLDAREVDRNFNKYLLIHMTEHGFRVTHHAVVVPCRHLDVQRVQAADDCANLTHMCKERNRTFLLHDGGVARHARNGQIFGEFADLVEVCSVE